MNSKECMDILRAMAIGASRTEKEAIAYAIKKIKKAKKWKKYRDMVKTREYHLDPYRNDVPWDAKKFVENFRIGD